MTVLNQTPSAFRQLVRGGRDGERRADALAAPRDLRRRGARARRRLRPWFDRHGDARPQLVNMYGITETTVHVTYRPIVARRTWTARPEPAPSAGRSRTSRLYVARTRTWSRCRSAWSGEIYVGGEGVARGYLGRPELTAERFVPDPFSRPARGAALPQRATSARLRQDGELEYLGRTDHQVKIRGFRIELGEIEAALAKQPEVREVAVVPQPDHRGARQLVAYLVSRTDATTDNRGAAPQAQAEPARIHGSVGLRGARGLSAHAATASSTSRPCRPMASTIRRWPASTSHPGRRPRTRSPRVWSDVLGIAPDRSP